MLFAKILRCIRAIALSGLTYFPFILVFALLLGFANRSFAAGTVAYGLQSGGTVVPGEPTISNGQRSRAIEACWWPVGYNPDAPPSLIIADEVRPAGLGVWDCYLNGNPKGNQAVALCVPDSGPAYNGFCPPPKPPTCENENPNSLIGNPTDLIDGLKREVSIDWISNKDGRFSITRHLKDWGLVRDFGVSWRSNWSDVLQFGTDRIYVHRANGDMVEFLLSGGVWISPEGDAELHLSQVGGQYELTQGSGTIDVFDANGDLIQRKWPDGYVVNIDRSVSGALYRISDNRSQSATFYPSTVTLGSNQVIGHTIIEPYSGDTDKKRYRLNYQFYTYHSETGQFNSTPYNDVFLRKVDLIENIPDGSGSYIVGDETQIQRYTYPLVFNEGTYLIRHSPQSKYDEDDVEIGFNLYDSSGKVTRSGFPDGENQTEFDYTTATEHTLTNALGKQSTYTIANVGGRDRITQIDGIATTHCLGTTKSFDYTPVPTTAPLGYVYERTERNGAVTKFEREATTGLVTKKSEYADAVAPNPLRETFYEWHADFRLPTKIKTSQMEERFTYDADGLLELYEQEDVLIDSPSFGEVRTWDFTYVTLPFGTPASGLKVLNQIDGPGLLANGVDDTIKYDYFDDGTLKKITNEVGHVTEITALNDLGQPEQMIEPTGVTVDFGYDFRGRLTSVTRQQGSGQLVTSFGYDATGLMTSMTLPSGAFWQYVYDDARRLTDVINPTGDKIEYQHDALGNVTNTKYFDEASVSTYELTQEYDALGRIRRNLGGMGQEWLFSHDKEDNLETVTDPLTNVVTNTIDPLNRVISVLDEASEVTGMQYNDNDAVTSYTDPRSLTTTTEYNGFGEVISEVSPDKGVTTYTYDSRGLVDTMTDARGITMLYSYDDAGRLLQIDYQNLSSTQNVDLQYDNLYGSHPNNVGQLTQIDDDSGQHQQFYEPRGLPNGRIVRPEGGIGQALTVAQIYDDDERPSILIYPSKRQIRFKRNAVGEITEVGTYGFDSVTSSYNPYELIAEAEDAQNDDNYWAPFGDVRELLRANGLSTLQTFDQSYRLTDQSDIYTANPTTNIRDHVYGYTARDNLVSAVDNGSYDLSADYQYDVRQMLRAAKVQASTPVEEIYSYDGVGNRTQVDTDIEPFGSIDSTETYAYDAASNRLASVTYDDGSTREFTYGLGGRVESETLKDPNGVPMTTTDYTYSHAGRLFKVNVNGVPQAEYAYNWLGQQVIRKANTPGGWLTIISMFDFEGRRIAEYDYTAGPGLTLLREYVWLEDHPLAVIENGEIYQIHWDHIDRPVAATDSTGAVVWAVRHDAFGGVHETLADTGVVEENLRFPGQWYQFETGLHQNWHRDYDPTLGRYLQPDPLGLIDGPSVYGYAKQSPVRYTDPRGEYVYSPGFDWGPKSLEGMAEGAAKSCLRLLGRTVGLAAAIVLWPTQACAAEKGNCEECPEPWAVYTVFFSNGVKYHGKGINCERANTSAREKARKYGVKVVKIDCQYTCTKNEAFVQEHIRIRADGGPALPHSGPGLPRNYNERNSPGRKRLSNPKR